MLDVCMISRGGGILGEGLGKSFVSAHGIKLRVKKGYVRGTLVGITGGDTDVAALLQ